MFSVFELAYFSLSIVLLGIGTYTDLKYRVISNKLTYSMIIIGLALHFFQGFFEKNLLIIGLAIATTIIAFVFSYLLWKTGVWAGGDVKLFIALAALNPINYAFLRNAFGIQFQLFDSLQLPLFPITLFIFSAFSVLPYGALLSIRGFLKKKELRKEAKSELKKIFFQTIEFALASIGTGIILSYFKLNLLLAIPIIIAWGFSGKAKKFLAIIFFAIGLYLSIIQQMLFPMLVQFLELIIALFLIYAVIKFFLMSRKIMKKTIKITGLKDGDIVGETIAMQKGKAKRIEPLSMKKVLYYLKSKNLKELRKESAGGREIVSHKRAMGVTIEEIKELKKLVKEKKLENKIIIKESVPFIPAVLIAYVVLSIVGDIVWNIIVKPYV